jgi:hypothetical protein
MAGVWRNRKILLFIPIFAAVSTFFLANVNWQAISDERKAREYQPTDEIISIVDELKLTEKGKTIFYAANPQLKTAAQISNYCDSTVGHYSLGCYYRGDNERIFLHDIETDNINENGLTYDFRASRNETALHELLHAVYDRLDASEQSKVCSSLNVIGDARLNDKLAVYSDEQRCTEAFARVGSEFIDLATDDLRSIYEDYFAIDDAFYASNRQNSQGLIDYSAKISNLATTLKAKKQIVDEMRSDYVSAPTWQKMNQTNAAIDEYNLLLKDYHSCVETYNKVVASI